MIFRTLTAMALAMGICAPAIANDVFSEEETEEINTMIESYLLSNPEKIIESLNKFQEKQMQEQKEATKKQLRMAKKEIFGDKTAPVIGKNDGSFEIVEFFDYNCGYCKMMFPKVLDFVEADGDTKWMLKELPTLSEESEIAAKIALAANKQGKYKEIHSAFMNNQGHLDKDAMLKLAGELGLDVEKLKKDMESDEVAEILMKNRELAGRIGVNGIPIFIIGDEMKPGAFDVEELKVLAEQARSEKAQNKLKRSERNRGNKDK